MSQTISARMMNPRTMPQAMFQTGDLCDPPLDSPLNPMMNGDKLMLAPI